MNNFSLPQAIHFIGIGGIGMSALARLCRYQGYRVTGSDIAASPLTEELEREGISVMIGHERAHIGKAQCIIHSSCINDSNLELSAARDKECMILSRGALLAALSETSTTIAVAGAHGKTTTTGLIASILIAGGLDPTVLLGGEVDFLNGNTRCGAGPYLVTEADESDGSFMLLSAHYGVVTNIDLEHLEYYRDMDHILSSYRVFADNVAHNGALFLTVDDTHSAALIADYRQPIVTVSVADDAMVRARAITMSGLSSTFMCLYNDKELGTFTIPLAGIHNISNALLAIAVSCRLGVTAEAIQSGFDQFHGTKRRFEINHLAQDITIIEDYAHHPTELKATLSSIRDWKAARLIAVFQPHRYTRTKFLGPLFGDCFHACDQVILTDVYAASEEPITGVDGEYLYHIVRQAGHRNASYVRRDEVLEQILRIIQPGDIIAILGAGDIGHVASELTQKLS